MKFKNIQNESVESADGKKLWKSRSVAVCVALWTSDQKFIVTKRSAAMEKDPGKKCLVCGFLDNNESIHQALIREVYEELGLNVNGMKAMMYHISDAPISPTQNISFHFFIPLPYDSETVKRKIKPCPIEVDEVYFMSANNVMADNDKEWAFSHRKRVLRLLCIAPNNQLSHNVTLDLEQRTQFDFWRDDDDVREE
jgi:NADH pyrophosphatase NudC (nudix superfamily)